MLKTAHSLAYILNLNILETQSVNINEWARGNESALHRKSTYCVGFVWQTYETGE